MLVADILVKDVVVLSPEDTLRDALIKLSEHSISGAPVVNAKNKLVGLVSEADILRELKTHYKELHMVFPYKGAGLVSFEKETRRKEIYAAFKETCEVKVKEVMEKNVKTASISDLVEDLIPMMVKERINRLPVVDKDGMLKGIITRSTILEKLYDESKELLHVRRAKKSLEEIELIRKMHKKERN